MKKQLDLEAIFKYQRKFASDREWEQFHTPKNLAMALSVEASELLELFQWLTPEQSKNIEKNSDLMKSVKDEISDTLYYILRMTDLLNIDLEEALSNKMAENEKKYPIEKSKGIAKKYSQL